MRYRPLTIALILAAVASVMAASRDQAPRPAVPQMSAAGETLPPVGKDSVKFLVLGDTGTGDRGQYDTAAQVWKSHAVFPYEFAIMVGDNIYGSERPQDFKNKFETPYKPLIDANIPFYAALGNHDDPNQRFYKPFGMNGQRFYTYQKKDVRFFALDSNYMDKDQQAWLEKELAASNSKWKIPYFHHPLYSSGATHGSEVDLRTIIEPLFKKYNVNVVFAGHEHFYERVKPQSGIYYFTAGGSAKLREGDLRKTNLTDKGFDTEQSFMLVELDGDVMRFQTISKHGKRVDSGEIARQNVGTQ
jgi:predicted phosphodiesterase